MTERQFVESLEVEQMMFILACSVIMSLHVCVLNLLIIHIHSDQATSEDCARCAVRRIYGNDPLWRIAAQLVVHE